MPGCVPVLSYDTLEERLNGFFFDYPTWIVKVDTLVADVKSGKMTSKDLNSLIVGIFGGNGIEGLPKATLKPNGGIVPNSKSLSWLAVEQSMNRLFLRRSPSNCEGNPSKVQKMLMQIKAGKGTLNDLNSQLERMFGESLDIEIPAPPKPVPKAAPKPMAVPEGNVPGTKISWKTFESRGRTFFEKYSPSNLEGNPSKFEKMLLMIINNKATAQGLNAQLKQMFSGECIDLSPEEEDDEDGDDY